MSHYVYSQEKQDPRFTCNCVTVKGVGGWGGAPYWLDDLHIPHRLVRGNIRPVRELLVPSSFNVEAVGESAQLVTVSI